MDIAAPLDIDHIEMFCVDHGEQVATGEVEGMTLYYSCPVAGCTQPEDDIELEVVS